MKIKKERPQKGKTLSPTTKTKDKSENNTKKKVVSKVSTQKKDKVKNTANTRAIAKQEKKDKKEVQIKEVEAILTENPVQFKFIDITYIRNPVALSAFVDWWALHPTLRVPKTQQDFAKAFKMHQDTLTDYKKLAGFWTETSFRAIEGARDELPEILFALKTKAKGGNPKHIEIYLKHVVGLAEKIDISANVVSHDLTDKQRERITNGVNAWKQSIKRFSQQDDGAYAEK